MDDAQHESDGWDAIVVGTGIGGATIGFALAQAGKRVLFCEKGLLPWRDPEAVSGVYPPSAPNFASRHLLAHAGRCWDAVEDRSRATARDFVPFIGYGAGGSSALYGMVMERFFPEDFEPGRRHPHAHGSSLPEAWPISYEDLRPHYEQAERLYGVRGGGDPLRPHPPAGDAAAPPQSALGQELYAFFQHAGLHPYRLPLACDFVAGCACCQGYLCAQACKNDAAKVCLRPALEAHGAEIWDNCEVLRLEASATRVTGAVCRRQGREITVRAPLVILAAGALETPLILLRSASSSWPNGLANTSGLVGRNLMRHYTDLYVIEAKAAAQENRFKEIGVSDYYYENDEKLGVVQSFGRLPPATMLADSLEDDLGYAGYTWLIPAYRLAKPVLRAALSRLVSRRAVLASILEDLPYPENRVTPVKYSEIGARYALHYNITENERRRIRIFRQKITQMLAPMQPRLLKQAENNRLLAHVCGTCRFGLEPAHSVLGYDNRAHGLDNLYVVDASFFPSSAGTNPSLTIAANALRVAERLK